RDSTRYLCRSEFPEGGRGRLHRAVVVGRKAKRRPTSKWPPQRQSRTFETLTSRDRQPFCCFFADRKASGVNGTCRIRTPVASKMALPTADATSVIVISPAPATGAFRLSIKIETISGIVSPNFKTQ